MKWADAVKQYYGNSEAYHYPSKGTPDYYRVMKILKGTTYPGEAQAPMWFRERKTPTMEQLEELNKSATSPIIDLIGYTKKVSDRPILVRRLRDMIETYYKNHPK